MAFQADQPNTQKTGQESKSSLSVVYHGKMFEVINWEGKPGVIFESVVRAPGTRLLIETKKNGIKALLMTREKRSDVGYDFRLPGGKVFDSLADFNKYRESGEDMNLAVEQAARKEGLEEAGISGGEYINLGVSKAGASVNWDLYYFKVTGAIIGERQLEESEVGNIETIILSPEEIFQKLSNKEIQEGRSADMLWSWLQQNKFISFNK